MSKTPDRHIAAGITRSGTTAEVVDLLGSPRRTGGGRRPRTTVLLADPAAPVTGLADLVRVHRLCVLRAQGAGIDADSPRNLTRSVILA